MDVAMGLISSLFDFASPRDVPFHQPQEVQCMHHGHTIALHCVPVLFADNAWCGFVIVQYGFTQAVPAPVHIFCIECIQVSCIVLRLYRCVTGEA